MAAYSNGFARTRVEDRQVGLPSKEVAANYRVSRAWVDRLMQRYRESGELEPRTQTKFRAQALAGKEAQLQALIDA
jgi:transposase